MKPLLAKTYSSKLVQFPCYVQPKLNGVRALYQNGRFQSRDGEPWHPEKLAHISKYLSEVIPENWILDGELYVHGWLLQDINAAVAVNSPLITDATPLVEYHIFDRAAPTLAFGDRWNSLRPYHAALIDSKIRFVPTQKIYDLPSAESFYCQAVSNGYEGIMYRLGDCPYTRPNEGTELWQPVNPRARFLSDKNNRAWHLVKRKDWQDYEFKIVGVEGGKGKRAGMTGALICETFIGSVFRVGSGLTDEQAIRYFEHPPIGRLAKVKFLTYTHKNIPFNPTLICVL